MKKITIIGLGYIGLPSAALLASRGYHIHGVDVVPEVVETINKGRIHIVEPDLDGFVRAAVDSGRLHASMVPEKSDIFIIAVPTPFKDNHEPDLSYVEQATQAIAPYIESGNIIILESTSPVGTTEMIEEVLKNEGVQVELLHIAHCPERVLPGRIMKELTENDRIVGGLNKDSTSIVADFYRTFVTGEVLETNARTAELSKLVENASRDVQIAFANELSMICDNMGINVWSVIELANRHPRVNILNPSTGVGGHCIAVDPWFIVNSDLKESVLIKTARERNLYKTEWIIDKISKKAEMMKKALGREVKIAALGLAFKPDIDDLRESPALYVAQQLIQRGLTILPVEPNIESHKSLKLYNYEEISNEADLLVYLVSHKEFYSISTEGKEYLDFCGVNK